MGKGRTKGGKAQKGKAQKGKGRRHSDEDWRHAQEVNAKRKADGKDTRSTASISRSLRRAQQKAAKAVEDSSSYYEETKAFCGTQRHR